MYDQQHCERDKIIELIKTNQLKLLYTTPEQLQMNTNLKSALQQLYDLELLSRMANDETHCISDWGHDFRPAYKQIGEFRKNFANVPIMALTATANSKTRLDICKSIQLKDCVLFEESINRCNLSYQIRHKMNSKITIEQIVEERKQYSSDVAIIYCNRIIDCEKITKSLSLNGVTAKSYHSQVDEKEKNNIMNEWENNVITTIVATVAFGMGVNKSNVRFIYHYQIPYTMQVYTQQCGRGGVFFRCHLMLKQGKRKLFVLWFELNLKV